MPQPLIISVILNTNRRADTLTCLDALAHSNYSNLQTIVLDNKSTDGSIEAIQAKFPNVKNISLPENLGYAGNNNVGMVEALKMGADWVLVLNEDVIFEVDCIQKLLEVGESNPQVGIVGPMVYHHNEPNVIQSAGGVLGKYWESDHLGKNEPDQGQFNEPHEVDWISGCAMLVRRAVIEQVGMLDKDYFIYWDETEWCIRAGKAGWKNIHVPQARLWHKGVQRDYKPKPSFTYYATRNQLFMLARHRAPFLVRLYTWFQIMRMLISWSVKPRWKDKREHRNAMWLGVRDYLRHRTGPMPS